MDFMLVGPRENETNASVADQPNEPEAELRNVAQACWEWLRYHGGGTVVAKEMNGRKICRLEFEWLE